MDSTRRGLSRWMSVLAAGLGTVIAVPLAALFALVYYLRTTASCIIALATFFGAAQDPKSNARASPAKPDPRDNRLAS